VTDFTQDLLQSIESRRPVILIVDDNPLNIQILYRVFAADHQVYMATSGEMALATCREKRLDLVLLDVEMPGMDGYMTCTRLKQDEHTQNIPVIFVTAHNDDQTETRGLSVGAVDFISKPFNTQVVRARVKTHITIKRQAEVLRQLALVDGLSGLFNRRSFDERFETEFRRSQRNGTSLALIMIDVDDFKRYNDCYGHVAGDDCLRRIATCLKAGLKRPADFVARYGGEEFVCLLPEIESDNALQIAHSLVQQVQQLGIAHAGSRAATVASISVGVACRSDAIATGAELLALADKALYRAKAEGRARACLA
jgi:diguanylate cyclase (GGDEF)-like protein